MVIVKSVIGSWAHSRSIGDTVVVYAGEYLNKLDGERIERECLSKFDSGCRALVINFKDTAVINSIGVSVLLCVIDAAEESHAQIVFTNVNHHITQLLELLGLMRHVTLTDSEDLAVALLNRPAPNPSTISRLC